MASCGDKKLGCNTCSAVSSINSKKTQGMTAPVKWINCHIKSYGSDVTAKQLSLRKKISNHKKSPYHVCATAVVKENADDIMPKTFAKQQTSLQETTERVFRTAYKQVKLNRPFSDFESEVDVQVLNGMNMGRILHSDKACGNIARHICTEMRKNLCKGILSTNQKFAILIDESTTCSKLPTMIVYLRTSFGGLDATVQPVTIFLDLVELACTNAQSILTSLLQCLNVHGFSDDFISNNLVGIATDGASVMLGKKSGVCKLLANRYPNIVTWHCLAHRLELSVHDTMREVSGTNHFKSFLDKIYSLNSMSPKNQNELRACAAEMEVQLLRIGKVLDTRWVASSVRTVRAVWECFPALYMHFKNASSDHLRDSRERAMYAGLADRLSSKEFLSNLALMYDALQELSELSLEFQRAKLTLPIAHKAIGRQILVFEALCNKPGPHLQEVEKQLANESAAIFKGVPLHSEKKCDVMIRREQFFRSLTENLRNRLLTIQSSNVSTTGDSFALDYQELLDNIKVLYSDNWPDIDLPNGQTALYGENEIAILAERFKVNARSSIRAFREFRENGGKTVPPGLLPLLLAVETIPVCTAECERGFSQMNLIISPVRNSLTVPTVSCLLFGKLVGPPLRLFKPDQYVMSWLARGKHSADDTNSKTRSVSERDNSLAQVWKLL